MTASIKLNYFLVWPLPKTAMGIQCNCLVGALPYTHCVIRSSPLRGVKVLHRAQKWSNSTTSRRNRQKQKQKTGPWLSRSRSERRPLQCRRQPTPTQPLYIHKIHMKGRGVNLCHTWPWSYDHRDPRIPIIRGGGGGKLPAAFH